MRFLRYVAFHKNLQAGGRNNTVAVSQESITPQTVIMPFGDKVRSSEKNTIQAGHDDRFGIINSCTFFTNPCKYLSITQFCKKLAIFCNLYPSPFSDFSFPLQCESTSMRSLMKTVGHISPGVFLSYRLCTSIYIASLMCGLQFRDRLN